MCSRGILAALLASVAVMAACGEEKSSQEDSVRKALASGEVKGLPDSYDCRLLERVDGYYTISCENEKTGEVPAGACVAVESGVVRAIRCEGATP
jgi:hypothetical protein